MKARGRAVALAIQSVTGAGRATTLTAVGQRRVGGVQVRRAATMYNANNRASAFTRAVKCGPLKMTDPLVLHCVRVGSKLRVRLLGPQRGYSPFVNIQFPRALRAEGAVFHVDAPLAIDMRNAVFYRINTKSIRPQPAHTPRPRVCGRELLRVSGVGARDAVCAVWPRLRVRRV